MNRNLVRNSIDIAKALKSRKQTGRCFHVCFAYHKTKCIKICTNSYDIKQPKTKYGIYKPIKSNNGNYTPGLHAEFRTILELGEVDYSKVDFLIIRIDNNNNTAISRPCSNCQNVLKMVGVKNIYYTTGDNEKVEKFKAARY